MPQIRRLRPPIALRNLTINSIGLMKVLCKDFAKETCTTPERKVEFGFFCQRVLTLSAEFPNAGYTDIIIEAPEPRKDVQCGDGTVKLTLSPFDPLGEIPVCNLIVCA